MMHPPERRTMDCDRLTLPEFWFRRKGHPGSSIRLFRVRNQMSGSHQTACIVQDIRHKNQKGFLQTIRFQTAEHISTLSYALTYSILLSTIRLKRPGCQSMEIKDFIILWKKCNILPSFLLIHIVDSTFHHQPTAGGPPFSPERETRARFSSYSFCILVFYTEEKVPHATVIPRL